jgi:hypothetical protein
MASPVLHSKSCPPSEIPDHSWELYLEFPNRVGGYRIVWCSDRLRTCRQKAKGLLKMLHQPLFLTGLLVLLPNFRPDVHLTQVARTRNDQIEGKRGPAE